MKYLHLLLAFPLLGGMLSSCGGDESDDAFKSAVATDTAKVESAVSSEIINDVIQSIPSPVEMSSLIKEVEPKYSGSMLNATENASKYTSNFKKAVNIGIYGTDLGYINIYNEKQDAITYLNSMTSLADELKIGHFFDRNTIKRLALNSNNLDSMLYITTNNYEKMNTYLQEQKRGNLSMLMLTGGWIEALYIASEVAVKNKNQQLIEKIGEQKVVLDQIELLLDFYKADPQVKSLYEKLIELKNIYNMIKITKVYAEPTVQEVNGMLMVMDNTKTTIEITLEDVASINNQVKVIRNELIN